MKRLLSSSVALNCVLVAVIGYLAMQDRGSRAASINRGSHDAAQSFDWKQIEAADYPTYIENLRAIGCPEETVRDIITADVAGLYEEREVTAGQPGSTRLAPLTRRATTSRRRDVEPRSFPQDALISALLARPSNVDRVTAGHSQNSELTHDADYQWSAPARDFGGARAMNNRTNGVPSHVGSANRIDPPVPEEMRQSAVRSDAVREDVVSVVPADENDAASRKVEGLFTVEEQRYRSLYGWAAFYAAKQEQAVQAAAEGE